MPVTPAVKHLTNPPVIVTVSLSEFAWAVTLTARRICFLEQLDACLNGCGTLIDPLYKVDPAAFAPQPANPEGTAK